MSEVIKFKSHEEMLSYLDNLMIADALKKKEILMSRIPKTTVEKRKNDSLEEILKVVSQLKEITSLHGQILNKIVENLATKKEEKEEKLPFGTVPASSIPSGRKFRRMSDGFVYQRLRPTSYLLNSTLVADSLNEGKVLAGNISTGSCFFILGSDPVVLLP